MQCSCTHIFIALFTTASYGKSPKVYQQMNGQTHRGIYVQWNNIQPSKEWRVHVTLWIHLQDNTLLKDGRHRRSYMMQFHLYGTWEIGKSIETECRGRGEQLLIRSRVSSGGGWQWFETRQRLLLLNTEKVLKATELHMLTWVILRQGNFVLLTPPPNTALGNRGKEQTEIWKITCSSRSSTVPLCQWHSFT